MKYVDAAVSYGAGVAFDTIQYFNRFNPTPSFTPKWTEKPLLKSWQKTKPVLGWPRQTDSLCPQCVKEAREKIIGGDTEWTELASRESRRGQGRDHRARRPGLDGQGLSAAWKDRRPDGDRREVPGVDRKELPRP